MTDNLQEFKRNSELYEEIQSKITYNKINVINKVTESNVISRTKKEKRIWNRQAKYKKWKAKWSSKPYKCEDCHFRGQKYDFLDDFWEARVRDRVFLCIKCYRSDCLFKWNS